MTDKELLAFVTEHVSGRRRLIDERCRDAEIPPEYRSAIVLLVYEMIAHDRIYREELQSLASAAATVPRELLQATP